MSDSLNTPQDKIQPKPSIGGANLECWLVYKNINYGYLSSVVEVAKECGFVPHEPEAFLARRGYEFVVIDSGHDMDEIYNTLKSQKVEEVIANFDGYLSDVTVVLTINLHFDHNTIVIAVSENFLWNYSDNLHAGDYSRLAAFGKVCKAIASIFDPIHVQIDTEATNSELIRQAVDFLGVLRSADDALSDRELKNLYDWYVNEYARRWE